MDNKKITPIKDMIIYKTTNLINGKIYIGQDSNNNPKYLGSGVIMLKAINKYGKVNFRKEIIDVAKTKEELDNKEIFWINELNSKDIKIGYNIASGGGGCLGCKASDERTYRVKKEGIYKGENNGNFKFLIKKDELFNLYITNDKTINEVSKYYGCSISVINDNIKKYNILKPKSNKYNFNENDLYKYYMLDNLSYATIAKIYTCSNKTIFKKIKKYGWVNVNTVKYVKESKFGLTYENLHQDFTINKSPKSEITIKYNCSIQLLNYTLKKFKLI
jgi:predicted DNA-binding protein YlxM (UPF0122 family)